MSPPPLPRDFDAYWQAMLAELAAIPAAPELEELPLRCTDEAACYAVRMTSLGPYRIFAYLSVPRATGRFPALFFAPNYQSVVEVLPQGSAREKRAQFVTLSLAARGQRNADQPYAAAFPGLLTDGIESPGSYVFRGIAADSVRGLEFLLSRSEVDRDRVAVVGSNDLALLTAALLPEVRLLATDCDLFYSSRSLVPRATGYPLEEINDLLRARPELAPAVFDTLEYFDPVHFAPRVAAETLLWAPGGLHDRAALEPLAAALGGPHELREVTGSRYLDGRFQEEWLSRRLGLEAPVLPAAWQ